MTQKSDTSLALLQWDGPVARLTLNRPERHNSLVPTLLSEMLGHLEEIRKNPQATALVLAANGKSFSTGGDVRAFYDQGDRMHAYAAEIVDLLNRVILALKALPIPVIGRIQGPVTGGALGLVLSCDLVAMSLNSFIQPFYSVVGFAPDGGWQAMLPNRIGARPAAEIMMLNQRLSPARAVQLGLASQAVPESELDPAIKTWLNGLSLKVPHSLRATKTGLWSAEQHASLAKALEEERCRFLAAIDLPETWAGMRKFLGTTDETSHLRGEVA